ncbi:Uncharacterised protein [Candidatus Burarchaeum australiense]|nr:Uncharacterised protein [Candidatus Burarchaeum australiense]
MPRKASSKSAAFKPTSVYSGPRGTTDTDYSSYAGSRLDWHTLKIFILGALAFTVISFIVHMAGAMVDMGYYMMPAYFSVWSPLMMPIAGPPPIEFTYASLLFGFITGAIFVYCYTLVRRAMPGNNWLSKGLNYGMFVMLLAGLPTYMSMTLLINLPQGLLVSWLVQSFITYELAGMAAARFAR